MRTIRVTGKGTLKLHPDLTRITITLSEVYKEYAEALKRSSEDTEKLKELLAGFGFEHKDLKTLGFNVDAEYESYREKDEYKQRLKGYRYRHNMKVEFGSDNDRLGRILYALANSKLRPEFSISYTVKDQEAAKNVLLGKAVADAKEKAAVLAEAAGLALGSIQTVDYSFGDMSMEVRPMGRMMAVNKMAAAGCEDECYSMDLEPDDISVSDTVTVVWEIN
jgi:uncharacterized protein YggE